MKITIFANFLHYSFFDVVLPMVGIIVGRFFLKKRNMHQKESKLQQACKRWFDLRFPHLAPLLFAVPNGHFRYLSEARRLKGEGVIAGVSDMILLYHGALCIEFKTDEGRQSPAQKRWEAVVTTYGAEYVIVRDVDSFIATVEGYITRNHKPTNDATQKDTTPEL